jgi:hypothetical protein
MIFHDQLQRFFKFLLRHVPLAIPTTKGIIWVAEMEKVKFKNFIFNKN